MTFRIKKSGKFSAVSAVRNRFQEGTYKISNAPYGYVPIDGKLVISEPEAEIVRQIFS